MSYDDVRLSAGPPRRPPPPVGVPGLGAGVGLVGGRVRRPAAAAAAADRPGRSGPAARDDYVPFVSSSGGGSGPAARDDYGAAPLGAAVSVLPSRWRRG
ncbi:hypothetical protein I4F81_004547 [Pyropia yezoensis]|uniref:Uncharacterized protein n=1 Tax=Pyropia yezoensis TaxID=2788 RepID=A0ACC3BW99_PYRYE|nr:hypothetical protein I4F81_004547 [Neopyropia yezoensis]